MATQPLQSQPNAGMMAAPTANPPLDWSRQPLPQGGGGVGVTGPGPGYGANTSSSGLDTNSLMPPKASDLTMGGLKQGLGNGIRNSLDPAGLLHGKFGNPMNAFDPAGIFGGSDPKKVKGSIDPVTGTYTASNYGKNNAAISAALTNYLRTGNIPPELKHANGMYVGAKKQIRQQLASGGVDGGAWKWGTPSAGAPTTIPSQGPVNWGNQPGTAPVQPAPGPGPAGPGSVTPPAPGAPPPAGSPSPGAPQASWTRPPQLPSPAAYNPQAAVAAALRKPTGGGSKLVGGYQGG